MQLNKVYAIDIDRSKITSCYPYVPFYRLGKGVFLNSQRRWQLSSNFNLFFFSLFSLYLIEYWYWCLGRAVYSCQIYMHRWFTKAAAAWKGELRDELIINDDSLLWKEHIIMFCLYK